MAIEYDERVIERLLRKLKEKEDYIYNQSMYVSDIETELPDIPDVSDLPDVPDIPEQKNIKDFENINIFNENINKIEKGVDIFKGYKVGKRETELDENPLFIFTKKLVDSIYHVQKDAAIQFKNVITKVRRTPIIGGLIEKALLATIMAETGLDVTQVIAYVQMSYAEMKFNLNIGFDIKRYGFIDGIRKNILDTIPNMLEVPAFILKPFYPESVKTDFTKGIGEGRMTDFTRLQKEHELNPTAHEKWLSAYIAHMAYKIPNDRVDFIDGYTYDAEDSDKNIIVYRNPIGDIMIGLRGTNKFDSRDLMADWAIATKTELYNELFETTLGRVERIVDKHNRTYGNEGNIYLSGHSLGGQLVNAIMAEPQLAESIHMATALAPGSAPKWLDWLLAPSDAETPQTKINKSGHDVSHLHNYITSPKDILSKSEGDSIPGTVHNHSNLGHRSWEQWDNLEWWEQEESNISSEQIEVEVEEDTSKITE